MNFKKVFSSLIILLLAASSEAQYNFWHTSLSSNSTQIPYSATVLVEGSASPSVVQMDVCNLVSITFKNVFGSNINRSSASTFPLTGISSGVAFYSDSTCSSSINSITLPSNNSAVSVYMKNTSSSYSSGSGSFSIDFSNFASGKTVAKTYTFGRPLTCLDALNKNFKDSSSTVLSSGTYTVDPDGNGAVGPFTVYCNMATSPSYANVNRGATLVAMYNPNDGAINYVENLPTALTNASNSTTLTNLKYQLLLGQSSRLWFLSSGSAGVNIIAPKNLAATANFNNNMSGTAPVAFTSATPKSVMNSGSHNVFIHDYYADNGYYTGLSFFSSVYLYRGSPHQGTGQPFYLWNGSSYVQTTYSQTPQQLPKNAGEVLYFWVY